MKHLFYILVASVLLSSCSEYQKVLKSEDVAAKFQMGEQLYNEGKYNKANRLFTQIVPAYRGKPQAEKLMFLNADSYYHTDQEYLAGYSFERFVNAYPRSEKLEEAYYKSAMSYATLSPVYSKDQHETKNALEKLQLFANLYPDSQYMTEVNETVKALEYKLELKAYSIAKQYNQISDYQASIKSFENFIANFPGSSLREKALFYRFDSAYQLATKSVERKKKQRIEDALNYYSAFKKLYSGSEFIEAADKMNEDLKQQLEQYSTNS